MKTINKFEGKYRFLSNYYPCKVVYEGIEYPSTEHAYQAAKTLNLEHRQMIADLPTPSASKKAGKIVELRSDWHDVKFQVMKDICKLKFIQPEFRQKLLDTGDAYLIEGNWWHDNTWGICTCSKCGFDGLNLLGKVLMQIRADIAMTESLHSSNFYDE